MSHSLLPGPSNGPFLIAHSVQTQREGEGRGGEKGGGGERGERGGRGEEGKRGIGGRPGK